MLSFLVEQVGARRMKLYIFSINDMLMANGGIFVVAVPGFKLLTPEW